MRVRYSKSLNVSNKVFGLLFAAAGFIPIIIMVVMIVLARAEDSKIPDDAEWYTGWITDVTSIDSRYVWKEDSDGDEYRVKVYDCKGLLEYEVNGQTYVYKYSVKGNDDPLQNGDRFYVKVSPDKPNRVYKVSTSKSEAGLYIGAAIFGIVGVIFVIIGLSTAGLGKKRKNKNSVNTNVNMTVSNGGFEPQMYQGGMNNMGNMGNFGQGYNVGQPYNGGQEYNNQGYNNQMNGNYGYYEEKRTDYSGTSLRD